MVVLMAKGISLVINISQRSILYIYGTVSAINHGVMLWLTGRHPWAGFRSGRGPKWIRAESLGTEVRGRGREDYRQGKGGEGGGRKESCDSHDGPPHLRLMVAVSCPAFTERSLITT